jgi:DNA-binding transcriptional MerR regulator
VLKIGEFAQVDQVSIATLRHYEKSGLLKPNALDPDTGYRYSEVQFPVETLSNTSNLVGYTTGRSGV